jgi:hypothetical protein
MVNLMFLKRFYTLFFALTFYSILAFSEEKTFQSVTQNAIKMPLSVAVTGSNNLIVSDYASLFYIDFF